MRRCSICGKDAKIEVLTMVRLSHECYPDGARETVSRIRYCDVCRNRLFSEIPQELKDAAIAGIVT